MKWSTFTTPPPRRPPPPKHPLFTTKFFSTKSFGPGHIVGAGVLVLGLVGLSKLFIAHGQEEAARGLSQFARPPRRPEDDPKLARIENDRGQYGAKQ